MSKKHRREETTEKLERISKKLKVEIGQVQPKSEKDTADERDCKDKKVKEKKKKERLEREEKEKRIEDVKLIEERGSIRKTTDEAEETNRENNIKDKKNKKVKDRKDKKNKKKETKDKKAKALAGKDETGNANKEKKSADAGSHDIYRQTKAPKAASQTELQNFLQTQNMDIFDPFSSGLRPILHFSELPSSDLVSKKPFATFPAPTPIQSASWPFSLDGRDVIGIAETGSGKTLAFSLPCIEALSRDKTPAGKDKRSAHPRAVIISPTRELAMQTNATLSGLAAEVGLSTVCLYGGIPKDDQRRLLRSPRGADIVVATPGRLKDFLSEGCVSLDCAGFAVLDEADRMLDKGFEDDVRLILGACPPRDRRQTLMFTATWPASVCGLAEGYMVSPVKITIGGRACAAAAADEDGQGAGGAVVELQANSRIVQKVAVVDPRDKEQRLLQILQEAQRGSGKNDRILVFCLYKKEAVRVERLLQRKDMRVVSIHGDLRQEQRTRSLEAFKAGTMTVLVATDVAARGLDIPEVKLVVNITFPLTIEDYVHRIGRTGRAGKEGKAITLFTEHDKAHSGSLINVLRAAKQHVPEELLKFGTTVKKKAHADYGAHFKDVDMSKKGTKITFG